MTTAYFDLETTGVDADAAITVAAVKLVHEGDESYQIFHDGHGTTMSAGTADKVVDLLASADVVYSYNGAAFDFRMLAAAASDSATAIEVCSRHRDVMLDFSATTGYYSAMNAWSANGATKTGTGAWAATAWFTDEAPAVAEYCAADTDVLHKIVERGLALGALARTAATTGRVSVWVLTDAVDGRPRFRTTAESIAAARDSPPDTSWMDNPPDITAAMQWARPCSP